MQQDEERSVSLQQQHDADHIVKGKHSSEIQRIKEFRCTRKETVGGDILIISRNSDGKVTQPIRTASETTLPVHFFQKLLANVM